MATEHVARPVWERLEERLPGVVMDHHDFRGDQTVRVAPDRLLEVVDALYGDGFQMLVDITAVDGYQRDPRFEVVYHLLNLASQERVRIKVPANEDRSLPSLTGRYKSADWAEREVFDLFGLAFEGHPDLRRLLLWRDFPGHPLRKDYPLDGGDAFCTQDSGTPYAGDVRPLSY